MKIGLGLYKQKTHVPRTCTKCNKTIEKCEEYIKHCQYRGPVKIRCTDPACAFRPSELTGSSKLATLYSAQESINDCAGNITDAASMDCLADVISDAAQEIEAVADEYRESASNISDSFGQTKQCDELEEKADAIDTWKDELENCASEIQALADEAMDLNDELEEKYRDAQEKAEEVAGNLEI